jgi:hypothetical protein
LGLVEHEAKWSDELEVVGQQRFERVGVAGELGSGQAVKGLVDGHQNGSFGSMTKD